MSKFKRFAILAMVLALAFVPAMAVFADSYSEYNSFQSIAYGHNDIEHFTSYSQRYNRSWSSTTVTGSAPQYREANIGAIAYTAVYCPDPNWDHSHGYGTP